MIFLMWPSAVTSNNVNSSTITHWPLACCREMQYIIFKLILVFDCWGITDEIALRLMALNLTNCTSTLIWVMAWCCQATSHYLSQCWPRFKPLHSISGPQCVKDIKNNFEWQNISWYSLMKMVIIIECHSGGHHRDHGSGTLSFDWLTATHLRIRYQFVR